MELGEQIKNQQESYASSCVRLYTYISKEGSNSFREGGALYKWRDGILLEKMINHFEETEEYEKCGVLSIILKEIRQK